MELDELDSRVTDLLGSLADQADDALLKRSQLDLHAGEYAMVTGRLVGRLRQGKLTVTPDQQAEMELLARESGLDV